MNNQASCLCGSVRWEITAEPYYAFNCHCKLCRKAHGSAFGTYWFVKPDQLNWLSDTRSIVHYRSSHLLVRAFCGTCGSVVPYGGDQGAEHMVSVGGCHDDGKMSDCHVFAAHKAPWYEISDELPRHDDYPEFTGFEDLGRDPIEEKPEGIVRGSCMCGTVKFNITEPFKVVQNCYCTRCRKARAAAHATNGFTSLDGVEFIQGEDNLASYKVPDAKYFTQVFCKTCGSKMPRLDPERQISVIPFGSLDDDPEARPERHIFANYKAGWHEITGDLPVFDEAPDG